MNDFFHQNAVFLFLGLSLTLLLPNRSDASGASSKKAKSVKIAPNPPAQESSPIDSEESRQLLVQFRDGVSAKKRTEIFKKFGLEEKSQITKNGLYLVNCSGATSLDSLIESLQQLPEVRFAEKNMQVKTYQPLNPNRATE